MSEQSERIYRYINVRGEVVDSIPGTRQHEEQRIAHEREWRRYEERKAERERRRKERTGAR